MTDYEAIKDKVDEALAAAGVKFDISYVAEVDSKWDEPEPGKKPMRVDEWRFTFKKMKPGGHSTATQHVWHNTFRTGIGCRLIPRISPSGMTFFKRDANKKIISATLSLNRYDRAAQLAASRPDKPRAGDVLGCILRDGEAAHQSFHDWASDFGYDTDSLKALNTYNACCEIGRELSKLFSIEEREQLQELTNEL